MRGRRTSPPSSINAHTIQIGDLVAMPRKATNGSHRRGDAFAYDAYDPYRHTRSVKWLEVSMRRDAFKQDPASFLRSVHDDL
jgi:predicted Mrr-cat superfamily restriction endonuclease